MKNLVSFIKSHTGEIFLTFVSIAFIATIVLTIIMVIGYENMNRL